MPLSPHLPIYRAQITSFMSIAHRLSELALYGIGIIAVIVLTGCAFFPKGMDMIAHGVPYAIGILLGLSISWVIAFHFLSSLRYLAWDMGWGFSLKHVELTGWGALLLAPLLSLYPYNIFALLKTMLTSSWQGG